MNNTELQVLRSIVSLEQYNNIEALLIGTKLPSDYPLISDWVKACEEVSEFTTNEIILATINEELKAQGVESIFDEDGNKLFSYCNVGDEFGLTVMYYWPKEKFIVSSFVNIIEALNEDMIEMFVNN